jgi:nitrate reductase delta subunit
MGIDVLLADAFRYPAPGRLEALQEGLAALPTGAAKNHLKDFVEQISSLSLGEWEELYTRTLDLNPPATPYIGYQTWGESYKRGEFMALINREMNALGIDADGELPDHLIPVLLYLGRSPRPVPEVLEILGPSVQRMRHVLHKKDPGNPYLSLFDAVVSLPKNEKQAENG